MPLLEQTVGRVLFNGFPAGDAITDVMVYGGLYSVTSYGRDTSVGSHVIERFLRPVYYRNCPDGMLPEALQNANPLGINRLIDGHNCREPL